MKWFIRVLFLIFTGAAVFFFLRERRWENRTTDDELPWWKKWFYLPHPFLRVVLKNLPLPEEERRKTEDSLKLFEERKTAEEYRLFKWTVCFWISWTGLAVLFGVSLAPRTEEKLIEYIAREEQSQQICVEAWIEGLDQPESLSFELDSRELTQEEKIQVLAEADAYIAAYFVSLGWLHRPPELPSEWGDAVFSYYSLEPLLVSDSGNPVDTWPAERTEIPFRVIVWVDDLKSSVDVSLCYESAANLTAAEQWNRLKADIQEGRFSDGEGISLPPTTDGGLVVRWQQAQKTVSLAAGLVLLLMAIIVFRVGADRVLAGKAAARKAEAKNAVPEIVGELLIYVNAGQSLSNAWMNVDAAYQSRRKQESNFLREEMHGSVMKLKNGFDFPACLEEFSDRVDLPEVRTLCQTLLKSRRFGAERTVADLSAMHQELWEEYGRAKRIFSEKADAKLLFPLLLMLIVVFIIVLAPAFMNLKMM